MSILKKVNVFNGEQSSLLEFAILMILKQTIGWIVEPLVGGQLLFLGVNIAIPYALVGIFVLSVALVLLACAILTFVATLIVVVCSGTLSLIAFFALYLGESIMFSTIFSLALRDAGTKTLYWRCISVARFDRWGNAKAYRPWNEQRTGSTLFCYISNS